MPTFDASKLVADIQDAVASLVKSYLKPLEDENRELREYIALLEADKRREKIAAITGGNGHDLHQVTAH